MRGFYCEVGRVYHWILVKADRSGSLTSMTVLGVCSVCNSWAPLQFKYLYHAKKWNKKPKCASVKWNTHARNSRANNILIKFGLVIIILTQVFYLSGTCRANETSDKKIKHQQANKIIWASLKILFFLRKSIWKPRKNWRTWWINWWIWIVKLTADAIKIWTHRKAYMTWANAKTIRRAGFLMFFL